MEFIHEFSLEILKEIIANALEEGYEIRITEWVDQWEREEGCPSFDYSISKEEFYKEYEGEVERILPESTKYGCSELNFTKDDEYICCYHIECCEEYIVRESLDFLDLDNLECWLEEEILEIINEDAIKYLHGQCQNWVQKHYKEGDKVLILLELDEETGINYLIHCCIIRNDKYLDVRGMTSDLEDVLEGFDYYNYEEFVFNNLENFMKGIKDFGVDFN